MSKENKTSDKQQNGNDFIADVSISFLIGQSNDLLKQNSIPFHVTEWGVETKEMKKEYQKNLDNLIKSIK